MTSNCTEDNRHSHCQTCVFLKCRLTDEASKSCPYMQCPYDCGAKFHECKKDEHLLLCPFEKVSCINFCNGCPVKMTRNKLGAHLSVCPASVLQCTMEWNRWPVYSRERKARVPFTQDNIHAKCGQLDVALALRDQRMLNSAMKAPRKTLRALRNPLTQRFPAVPFIPKNIEPDFDDNYESQNTSRTVSDDDSDAPWEVAKDPPGLQRSVCSELFKTSKKSQDNISLAPSESVLVGNDETEILAMTLTNSKPDHYSNNQEMNTKYAKSHVLDRNIDESTCTPVTGGACEQLVENSTEEDILKEMSELHIDIPVDEASTISLTPIPPPPPPSLTLRNILGLDLNLESITRYQQKPKSMYTFLCAQCFRRDQFPWHFSNTHCDIQSGLNGWLEHRCPLAQYGCTYSQRRFHPLQKGSAVIFSSLQESFGIKMMTTVLYPSSSLVKENKYEDHVKNAQKKEPTPEIFTSGDFDSIVQVQGNLQSRQKSPVKSPQSPGSAGNLTVLPFEVLRIICLYLDSFSLNNMAVTSRYLRQVCCSILEERGIVVQEWLSKEVDGRKHWYIGYKRWFFSTAYSPVEKWGIERNPHMAEHLKNCPFYHRELKKEPFDLGMVSGLTQVEDPDFHHSPTFWRIMENMYPGQDIRKREEVRRAQQKELYDKQVKELEKMIDSGLKDNMTEHEFLSSNGAAYIESNNPDWTPLESVFMAHR